MRLNKSLNLKSISLLIIILTSSCGISIPGTKTYNREIQTIQESQVSVDKISRRIGNPYDVNDLTGCPVLLKLGPLEEDGREYKWRSNNWEVSSGIALDFKYHKIPEIIKNEYKLYNIVYIGPWKYSKKLNKEIRFFAFQKQSVIEIQYQFESKNENNKNITEKAFNLSKKIGFDLPDINSLCQVKWIAKYGYNAVYNKKLGKIVEAEE